MWYVLFGILRFKAVPLAWFNVIKYEKEWDRIYGTDDVCIMQSSGALAERTNFSEDGLALPNFER